MAPYSKFSNLFISSKYVKVIYLLLCNKEIKMMGDIGFKTLDLINEVFCFDKMFSSNKNGIVFMKHYPDKSS